MSTRNAKAPDTAWERLTDALPAPVDPAACQDLLWREYSAQFAWYDRAATRNRIYHRVLDYLALVAGAAVTILAALSAPAPVTAAVGATIVVSEGAQKIGQFHANWLNYRATAERMRQHGFAYAAGTVPYDEPSTRRDRLVEFMRETLHSESTTWTDSAIKATRATSQ